MLLTFHSSRVVGNWICNYWLSGEELLRIQSYRRRMLESYYICGYRRLLELLLSLFPAYDNFAFLHFVVGGWYEVDFEASS